MLQDPYSVSDHYGTFYIQGLILYKKIFITCPILGRLHYLMNISFEKDKKSTQGY